ncbi:toll/interleukin-1 receptor domain-containing protein [Mobiluncus mulieris]|uniref:toll/interleukin-1 receptor domain-containing protein n=1 Tax=Mobiluncus mulieris TaxID=2052 RepID=UPI001470074C|nr:toll/interleukin-1 receptor domain-containing protein [Mobiluncus mulieris]MCU9971365.1 TIR domain-containing protein [Mobiluncus mulieris]MCU9975843.1 TIR domain-containing protein [Mobiluncus mulieris]MCV0002711.1 TIR domain-containing protein [Mobiluncus mulieris]NMW91385.1 toll/interleukin-1 receptor domain-containing protein [Mobiluncus mulieris]
MNLIANLLLFVSYHHDDNDYLNGAITDLVRDIIKNLEYSFGEAVELFIDEDNIEWGAELHKTIENDLLYTDFLLAMVTPRYFRSEYCCYEFNKFFHLAEKDYVPHVLSLIMQPLNESNQPKTELKKLKNICIMNYQRR